MDNQQEKHVKCSEGDGNEEAAAAPATLTAPLHRTNRHHRDHHHHHHPWDEVSLPGAGINDQETIIQVFNPANSKNEKIAANSSELKRTRINSETEIADNKETKRANNRAGVTASDSAFVEANNRTNLTEENKEAVIVNRCENLTETNAGAGVISNNNETAAENNSEALTEKSCSTFSVKNNGILVTNRNKVIEENNNEILTENNCSDFREINKCTSTADNILPTNIDRYNREELLGIQQNCNNKSFDVTDNAQFSINLDLIDPSVKRNHIESDNLVSSYFKENNYNPTISFNKLNIEIPSLPTSTATPTTPPPTPSSSTSPATTTTTATTPLSAETEKSLEYPGNEKADRNVLHIDSHLIETYDNRGRTSEDGVGISELTPLKEELTKGPSRIETDGNVRTIIEVEPAGSKIIIKPVETLPQKQKSQNITEFINPIELSKELKCRSDENIEEIEEESVLKVEEDASQAAVYTERDKPKQLDEFENDSINKTIEETPQTLSTLSQKNTEESLLPKAEIDSKLSQEVDEQLSEITNILREKSIAGYSNGVVVPDESVKTSSISAEHPKNSIEKKSEQIKLVELSDLPAPNNASEEEERKLFIDSLPQISEAPEKGTDSDLTTAQKREYYRTLRKYLAQQNSEKPPIPLQTYRWEDLRRAKERGGYPWTHLYKRPLGPDEEPEIVLLLRKSQELRFASESPKSLKKVHYDEQVLVTETERYINEIAEEEDNSTQAELQLPAEAEPESVPSVRSESFSCLSDSILAAERPHKSKKIDKIRGFLRRRRKSGRFAEDAQSLPGTSVNNSRHHSVETINTEPQEVEINGNPPKKEETGEEGLKKQRCFPIMKKLKNMADRQKKRMNVKRIALKKGERIVFGDETKIMNLKSSPKSDRNEIPHFIEKQDSDDVLEIVELDESPSRKHKDTQEQNNEVEKSHERSVVEPDEIIELAKEIPKTETAKNAETPEANVSNIPEDEIKTKSTLDDSPPRKTPRLRREHVYEEINQSDTTVEPLNELLDMEGSVEALKNSLTKQDDSLRKDLETSDKSAPLDRMGSSDEEQLTGSDGNTKPTPLGLLAPISSIDSASSEEDRGKIHLAAVAEESDVASTDGLKSSIEETSNQQIANTHEEKNEIINNKELKPSIKKEASPAPSDKKVTFSPNEYDNEPHREDIELPEGVREARENRWKNMSDHDYEPIGEPSAEEKVPITEDSKETLSTEAPAQPQVAEEEAPSKPESPSLEEEEVRNEMKEAEELQRELEERYFNTQITSPQNETPIKNDSQPSQVDADSGQEKLPLQPENRRRSIIATAQDHTRKMQAGIKTQANKIKTKLRSPTKKPVPSDSPKAKERRRFKAPEFSKMKMPELKRPDLSKLKEFKRPEFTKFNKPDMSKFKLPEKFSALKVRRSKSFKENVETADDEVTPETSPSEMQPAPQATTHHKKMFEFNFGTYPRALRKKKKPSEPIEISLGTGTGPSVIPSTETHPSLESSSSPQGDRGPGPVRSRWADKFSDVSYNDSEGSRYRRYGSEQESFDRESSLERRMREDIDEMPDEETNLGLLGSVSDNKQFAEFDEENRAIHEISNLRAGEFKRRPFVHQDSDLVSEESKDAVGWTEKEVQKNILLRKAEIETEGYTNYPLDDRNTQETQSTASSGKKVVMEEIDDDEFFLRKRGVSEDNIELRQYISSAIREGLETPVNALEHIGQTNEPPEYGDYDIPPPPKPRRLHKTYRPDDLSKEFDLQHSDYGDDLSISQAGSDYVGVPKRPLRKRRSRSKYSIDSQELSATDTIHRPQYFDDDEEYLRPPGLSAKENEVEELQKTHYASKGAREDKVEDRPEVPRRRKRQQRETSMDKDSYINGFGGRSVSNSFLQPPEDVMAYRTQLEYPIPLATPENYSQTGTSTHFEDDDRTSRGTESLGIEQFRMDAKGLRGISSDDVQAKYITDMMETDGYATVRKEHLPKPTPPARRKKFSRSPGERFATMPHMRGPRRGSPIPPKRPPPPSGYSSLQSSVVGVPIDPHRKSALSLDISQNIDDDYEELQQLDHERPESPRDLQSGDIINKMKYRPLPPPPRPPRDRRQQRGATGRDFKRDSLHDADYFDKLDGENERIATSSTAESYDHEAESESNDPRSVEVEVSTQTDPLPDDFVCEEFEITDDMKIIFPRKPPKTLDDILAEESTEQDGDENLTEEEQLARGLQRFRDANQRSLSEKSRASSQADRSKSQSRPQTPSAVVIERKVSTPIPSRETTESLVEAALIVRPIDDLDIEEEALRGEGLLSDSSQHSKSDLDDRYLEDDLKLVRDYLQESDSDRLEEILKDLRSQIESERETEDDKEVEQTMQSHTEEKSILKEEPIKIKDPQPPRIDITPPPPPDHLEDVHDRKDGLADGSLKTTYDQKLSFYPVSAKELEKTKEDDIILEEPSPQPPPRRRSSSTTDPSLLTIAEQPITQDLVSQLSITSQPTLGTHMSIADLEVDRLRVHALQAGKIMVSQLHGTQISSDDLECKSGNLVVKNIELPAGFIEDIVERVRSTERSQLHVAETQTSLQGSDETLSKESILPSPHGPIPPLKPPRQRPTEATLPAMPPKSSDAQSTPPSPQQPRQNLDIDTTNESTQTMESMSSPSSLPSAAFPTIEYLQSLAPFAFYNLQHLESTSDTITTRPRRRPRHRRSLESSPSEEEMGDDRVAEDRDNRNIERHQLRTRDPISRIDDDVQTVAEAGRQFLSACSLSLINIINQLTNYIRKATQNDQENVTTRSRQIPILVALFIFTTFGILLFILSGRNIHHHHWDFFNLPGNNGRSS